MASTIQVRYRTVVLTLAVVIAFSGLVSSYAAASPSGMVAVHRFYLTTTGTHFYTASESEADRVKSTMSDKYRYESVAFHAYGSSLADVSAVYRFYNKLNGTHFYTASSTEYARVKNTLSGTYRYEKVAYYYPSASGTGNASVHRFYNKKQGTHFYTASETEAARVKNIMSATYRYENIAYSAIRSEYYANCTEAHDAGVTPIYRGEPGYRSALDRDNDNIACEVSGD